MTWSHRSHAIRTPAWLADRSHSQNTVHYSNNCTLDKCTEHCKYTTRWKTTPNKMLRRKYLQKSRSNFCIHEWGCLNAAQRQCKKTNLSCWINDHAVKHRFDGTLRPRCKKLMTFVSFVTVTYFRLQVSATTSTLATYNNYFSSK